jgi:hypothetical protein
MKMIVDSKYHRIRGKILKVLRIILTKETQAPHARFLHLGQFYSLNGFHLLLDYLSNAHFVLPELASSPEFPQLELF